MSTRVLARGIDAARTAARILPLMSPINSGGFNIPVGIIDREQNMIILGQAGGEVYYIMSNELRALGMGQFLQGYFIGRVASEVYRRTAWLIPASRITMAFSMGVLCGFLALEGLIAGIVVTGVRVAVLIESHPREVAAIREHLPTAVEHIKWFKTNCPVLYSKFRAIIGTAIWEAIEASPSGVTAEDVAKVVGMLLGGAGRAFSGEAPATAFTILWNCVARPLIAAVLRAPGAVVRGTVAERESIARAIAAEIRAQSVLVSAAEEQQIINELRTATEAVTRLENLRTALEALNPAIDQLVQAWNR